MNNKSLCILLIMMCSGCSGDAAEFSMPMYEQCTKQVELMQKEYDEKFRGSQQSLNFTIERFSSLSGAHDDIIGALKITGKNLQIGIDRYANTIKSKCYPGSSLVLSNDKNGIEDLATELMRQKPKGTGKLYINVSKEEIEVFFDNTNTFGRY